MCEVCDTYNAIQVNANLVDPTRTTTLRKAFAAEAKRRFRRIARNVTDAVITQDVFGQNNPVTFARPTRRAFNFPRKADKISSFMEWLEGMVRVELLEMNTEAQLGVGIESAWTDKYIADSYKRGVLRARAEMKKSGMRNPAIGDTSIQAVLNGPFHADRVGVLYTRVFSDLRGISAQMDTMISRVLSQGMIDGDNPRTIARKLLKVINGLGDFSLTDTVGRFIPAERRAIILARTEVIRAHHQGMMQEMTNWGVVGVKLKAEFLTAGDNRVCPTCVGMEGNIYTLEEAWNIIPVHPQCRCIVLPITNDKIN